MVQPSDVKWGAYKQYEGPVFWGSRKFQLPPNPTDNHKVLAVITATEGGSMDAVNAYDRCIVSVGLIQWCEAAYYLTSNLLGAILEKDLSLMSHLAPALSASGAVFQKKAPGKWRFYVGGNEVDTAAEQHQLFFRGVNGTKGSWNDPARQHARLWVSCLANLLAQDTAVQVQVDYTAARVKTFAVPSAKTLLLDDPAPSTGWVGALRSAFLSFAANLPAVAGRQLEAAVKSTGAPKWSEDWCLHILKTLTFGPNISIYPERYGKIRPVIERLYGVNLPDFAEDLKAWQTAQGPCPVNVPSFQRPEEIQELLIRLGYDLGSAGADGKIGPKTIDAIMVFQGLNGLVSDGIVGPKTRAKLVDAWTRLGAP